MGRFLARMLVAFLASVAFSPVASAAEIPPTNECTALYKKVLADYPKRSSKKADRIAATALVDGGCVTDAEPLLKDVKTKPFSKQCKIASRAAADYWKPNTAQLRPLIGAWQRRWVPLNRRIGRIQRRIEKLKRQDSSPARIRVLIRKRNSLKRKSGRIYRRTARKANAITVPQAYQTSLIYTELLSLRCLSQGSDLGEKNPKTPALRAIGRNRTLVFASMFYVAFKTLADAEAKEDASISASDGCMFRFGETATGRSLPAVPFLP